MTKVKEISLTKGFVTIVDEEDFEELNRYNWRTLNAKSNLSYAVRSLKRISGSPRQTELMHRKIMNPRKGYIIDHIDGDGLNNRKGNLRICTIGENLANKIKIRKKTTSKYKGVHYHAVAKKWASSFGKNGQVYHIGLYLTEIEAAVAYNNKAKEVHGEFAKLNIVQ